MRDVGEDFALKQIRKDGSTLCAARRTQSATLAGERYEKLEATLRTNDSGETGFEEPTIEIAGDGFIPVPPPEPVALLESLVPDTLAGFVVLVQELVKRSGAGRLKILDFGLAANARQVRGSRKGRSGGGSVEGSAPASDDTT